MKAPPAGLIARNATRWANAKLTRGPEFTPVAKRLVSGKVRYKAVEVRTGVPWFVIAVIHQRESSQNWQRSLAQGDPWNQVSTHVPKGRGPFRSWEEAAVDALVNCAPYASKWKDWSPGGTMTLLEMYNGLGYYNKGIPSPYVWSGTDQYSRGKYIADGVFDANAVDKQLGCAGLILAIRQIDPTAEFDTVRHTPLPTPKPVTTKEKVQAGAAGVGIVGGLGLALAYIGSHPHIVMSGIIAFLVMAVIAYKFLRKRSSQ